MADDRFQNKYRIPSARAAWWDYGDSGAYFVTICTKGKGHFFGKISEKQLVVTKTGELAAHLWHEIPHHFPYAQLGAFIVMPNHIHGIIIIEKPISAVVVETQFIASDTRKQSEHKMTKDPNHLNNPPGGITGDKNPMLSDNLSRILRWYTGRVSFESHKIDANFGWQARFYDHIIRSDESYHRISEYILNNPAKWEEDRFYCE